MSGRLVPFFVLWGCLLDLAFAEVQEETVVTSPVVAFPQGFGYSFSEQTGVGFLYRFLDNQGGWQVSAVATNHHNFQNPTIELYSVGAAKGFTLFSFVATEWLFSQLYWSVGASWRSQSFYSFVGRRPSGSDGSSEYEDDWVKHWHQVASVGPVLGVEVGLFEHFSLNLELGYHLGYDFGADNLNQALILTPGVSSNLLFRF